MSDRLRACGAWLYDHVRRWRTWIFNTVAALLVGLPDLMNSLAGVDWHSFVPPKYMWAPTLAIILVNIAMRPRPAVLPHEAKDGK